MSSPSRDDGTRVPDPVPLPPPPHNGKPGQPPACIFCFERPAVQLPSMGLFSCVSAFCSVECAASHALDAFISRVTRRCDFCGNPCDHFHQCWRCDIRFTLCDQQNEEEDVFEPVNEKEVGG